MSPDRFAPVGPLGGLWLPQNERGPLADPAHVAKGKFALGWQLLRVESTVVVYDGPDLSVAS